MASNAEIIKDAYAKFGAGDVEGVVSMCDEAVVFNFYPSSVSEEPALPHLNKLTGKEGALKFFQLMGSVGTHEKFEIKAVAADGPIVLACIEEVGKVVSTGKTVNQLYAHYWELNEAGKIVKWQPFPDTKAMFEAVQP